MKILSFDRLLPMVVVVIGCLSSFALFGWMRNAEDRLIREQLEQSVLVLKDSVLLEVNSALEILAGIQGLFQASEHVSRNEFAVFTGLYLSKKEQIQALEWVPRVTAETREVWEAQARQYGLAPSGITERQADGTLVRAGRRSEYFPVLYAEPLRRNQTALGFDLGSTPERLDTLQRAAATRQPQMTPSIQLVQAPEKGRAVLVFFPVFDKEVHTGATQVPVEGFALGVFLVEEMIVPAIDLQGRLLEQLALTLVDVNGDRDEELFERPPLQGRTLAGWSVEVPLDVPGRRWEIRVRATDSYLAQRRTWEPQLVLVGGSLSSALLAFWLWGLLRREKEIKVQVELKTRKLAHSEDQNRTLIENAVDAIISIDSQGVIALFNPAAETMFGYRADEVIGHNVSQLMPEPYRSAHDGYLANYLRTGQAKIIGTGRHVEGLRSNGERFPMHLSVGQVGHNNERSFVGVVKDMTLEQQARDELVRAKEMAEQLNRQQAAFINTTSHELRTPLTVLLGYLPLLKNLENPLPSEMVAQIAGDMDQSGHQLLGLINDILDISKIDAGMLKLRRETLDLSPLVDRVLSNFRNMADNKKVGLKTRLEPLRVDADPRRLQQILTNLVSNALKFTQQGAVEVSAQPQGDRVRIEVRDSGVGIPSDQRAQIFAPFHQVDNSSTRKAGGTGLGLAITRELVELHGGTLEVESEVGVGSVFKLTLAGVKEDKHGEDPVGRG